MRKMIAKFAVGSLSLAMVAAMATMTTEDTVSAKVNVKKVEVTSASGKTAFVAKGKKIRLKANVKVSPSKGANKKVSYKTSNKKVATVSGKGEVKGIKPGSAKITVISAKNKKKKATIKVVVKAAAVKSINLNSKKATMNIGETKKLTAKVNPKNACTKLEWSSSRSNIATVSNGVVRAKKAGNVKITAKAVDGSGKRATCNIQVKDSISIVGMDIQNAQTITFSLDRAKALSAGEIVIKRKRYASGTYNDQMKIDTVTTTDQKNYTVVLNADTRISVGDYVQVSVPSLPGNAKAMEKEYRNEVVAYTGETIWTWDVNEYDSKSMDLADYGYASYTVSGVPDGLKYEVKGGDLCVKGAPKVAGSYNVQIKAVDELGNTVDESLTILVGSEDKIVAAATQQYGLVAGADAYNVSTKISAVGGSGSYKYEIISDTTASMKVGYNSSDDDDDYDRNEIHGKILAPGEYQTVVRVTDNVNPALTQDVTVQFHIQQGISVAGILKDASGNPLGGASIRFINKNRADRYFTYGYFSSNSETGAYSACIAKGTYDIEAVFDKGDADFAKAHNYLYKQELNETKSGFDFTMDINKVALVASDDETKDKINNTYWYVDHEYVGHGSVIYLKNGNYTIESESTSNKDWWSGEYYKLSANVVVNNALAQAAITKQPAKAEKGAKDTPHKVELNRWYASDDAGEYKAFRFTPQVSGKYRISDDYYNIKVFKADHTEVKAEYDDDYNYYNLEAGVDYIIGREDGYYFEFSIYAAPGLPTGSVQ